MSASLAACGIDPAEEEVDETSQEISGWHGLSQAARNQAIVDATAAWGNGSWGGQCKVWVQNVVNAASGASGLIPTNNGSCYWNYGPYVVGRSGSIQTANPGEIIQMTLTSGGPHTAIVVSKGSYGITFKESNWCSGNCELVGTRYVTYGAFNSQVSCFSIYYVL
jgi:hypothetical protein